MRGGLVPGRCPTGKEALFLQPTSGAGAAMLSGLALGAAAPVLVVVQVDPWRRLGLRPSISAELEGVSEVLVSESAAERDLLRQPLLGATLRLRLALLILARNPRKDLSKRRTVGT